MRKRSRNNHRIFRLGLLVLFGVCLVAGAVAFTKKERVGSVLGAIISFRPDGSSGFWVYPATPRIDQLGKLDIFARVSGAPYSGEALVRYFLCSREAGSIYDSSCKYAETRWSGPLLSFVNGRLTTDLAKLSLEGKYWAPVGKYFLTLQRLDKLGNPIEKQSNQFSYIIDPVDMQPYWNLESQNSYVFEGKNYMVKDNFGMPTRSKVQVDVKPSPACGINYYGFTFSKSNPTGYFDPCVEKSRCGNPKIANSGAYNTNFYVAWVANNEVKGESYLASNLTNFVDTLGRYIPEYTTSPTLSGPRSAFTAENYDGARSTTKRIFMRSSDNPNSNIGYNLGPRYLDLSKLNDTNPVYVNRQEFYDFAQQWKSLATNSEKTNLACNLVNNYKSGVIPSTLAGGSFFTTYVANMKYEMVSTPAYSGPAMRLSMREIVRCGSYADFLAKKCENVLREDWYLAKGVGLVKIAQNYSNSYGYVGPNCSADSDCNSVSSAIQRPEYEQVLIKYGKI